MVSEALTAARGSPRYASYLLKISKAALARILHARPHLAPLYKGPRHFCQSCKSLPLLAYRHILPIQESGC